MENKLIECVPNFSEGRDPAVIDTISRAITEDGACELWDHSADPDHNRSVFTLAGTPEAVGNAVLRFTRTAAQLINMETHEGVHPCIGAADVIPFIPLKNTSMEECITLSETIGKRIADELDLPVYLYARSARTASHIRLADIRRGGYHTLKNVISSDPDRAPDLGPRRLGPAGGVSIGARNFLIAFNVYLNTSDPAPAKSIARKIRASSGGLAGVQAIGLQVKGLGQVSMNLLDHQRTSLKDVFAAIRAEASELGCAPLYSELIGMLPRAAFSGISPEELLLRDFDKNRILEEHFH